MVDIPTATDVTTRYPEFKQVDEARVEIFIEDASGHVDDTWTQRDQKKAIMALTAHMMTKEGEPANSISLAAGGSGTGAASNSGAETFLKKRTVGDVSSEYEETASSKAGGGDTSSSSGNDFKSTSYGEQYYRLLRLNFKAPVVI